MQHLKSETLKIADIPQGSPIELTGLEDVVKRYKQPLHKTPGAADYDTEPLPREGILNTQIAGSGHIVPLVTIFKDGESIKIHGRATAADRRVKMLTGTTGAKLKDAWTSTLAARITDTFTKVYSIENGCDPEIFVVDADGTVIPAWEFLPGKAAPLEHNGGGGVYWDGFQGEFTARQTSCLNQHVDYVQKGLKMLRDAAVRKFPGAKLSPKCVMDIPHAMLATETEEHVNLGCGVSFNAYGLEPVKVPFPRQLEFRPAGGHFHLGCRQLKDHAKEVVQTIDAVAGVAMTAMMAGLDDPRRRTLYGRAGEYRLPAHGIEYRVLSNGWLRHPAIMMLAFDMVRMGANLFGIGASNLWKAQPEEIQQAINECDVKLARAIVERNKKLFCGLLYSMADKAAINHNKFAPEKRPKEFADTAYLVVMDGIGAHMKNPDDVAGNWSLDTVWNSHAENKDVQWRVAARSITQGEKI